MRLTQELIDAGAVLIPCGTCSRGTTEHATAAYLLELYRSWPNWQ